MNADVICAKFGNYVAETCQQTDTRLCDIPEENEAPELVLPRPPTPKDMSDVIPTAIPQKMGRAKHGENMVPRWRLAREGPFGEEQSAESICSLGPGGAFRNTTYRVADYAEPAGEFGLLLNHPRFLEWIRVPQSAGLLELSGMQWVDRLFRSEVVTAEVHLQWDVGLMQTNVDVLSLQKVASRIIDTCLGPSKYPASEVETGTLGPRVYRAAKQMESMGLWRPSMDPL